MASNLRPQQNKNLLYIYDLPQKDYTSVQLAKIIKDLTGYEIERMPQVRRDLNKPFYSAVIQINDDAKFKEVSKALRYFTINEKACRALPFTNELLGSNVTRLASNNIFVRKVPKNIIGEAFEQSFAQYGEIISCKVSLNEDHSSRGYGFVCFRDPEAAEKAIQKSAHNDSSIGVRFAPRDKKEFRKAYNNVYVKNLPAGWGEEQVRKLFGEFGRIASVYMASHENGPYAFVCYEAADAADRETGPRCAQSAVEGLHDKEVEGCKLYVRPGLKKGERERELMHETFKYKNSKKRCNLYVKGFPSSTTEEDLRALFAKFGEVESLKLFPAKDNKQPFAFVCFKTPDQASQAKTTLSTHQIDNHPLYINHYEIKQYRDMNNEMQKDKQDFQRYQAENSGGLQDFQNSDEIMNLLRLLIHQGYLKKMHQGNQGPRQGNYQQHPGHQGQHPGQNQGHRQNYNQGPRPNQHMRQQQMPMAQQMAQAQQAMPAAQPMPQAMPPAAQKQANDIASQYLQKTMPILAAIVQENPSYQQHVGSCIFSFVQDICGPDYAPKITGMLIDLPIFEIHLYMKDYNVLAERVLQARDLLDKQRTQ